MSRQRGHVLLLTMLVLAAILAAGLVFTARVQTRIDARETEEVRLQALWLARSALDAGVTGSRTVATPVGEARVRVQGIGAVATAEVELSGARATVSGEPRVERFEGAATRAR